MERKMTFRKSRLDSLPALAILLVYLLPAKELRAQYPGYGSNNAAYLMWVKGNDTMTQDVVSSKIGTTPATADGDTVRAWKDASGIKTNDWTSASTTRGGIYTISNPLFNFNPALRCFNPGGTNTGTNLSIGSNVVTNSSNGVTVFVVGYSTVSLAGMSGTYQSALASGPINSGNGFWVMLTSDRCGLRATTNLFTNTTTALNPVPNHLMTMSWKFNPATTANDWISLYQEGALSVPTYAAASWGTTWGQSLASGNSGQGTASGYMGVGSQATWNASQGSRALNGTVAEILMLNADSANLPAGTYAKINSYLALKYGITLNQTTAQNYISTNGNVFWNASTAGTFNNDIFGIGRDDSTALLQKVSHSINGDGLFVLTLDNDYTSLNQHSSRTTGFAADTTYVMLGNDNGVFTFGTTGLVSYHGHSRISRTWQMQKRGNIDSVYIGFHKDSLSTTPAGTDLYLLRSNTNVFTQRAAFTYARMAYNGTTGYYWLKIPVTHLQYITVAAVKKNALMRHRKQFLFGDLLNYNIR